MNRNAILQLEHAAGLLASLGPLADTLAKDLTPMPDGQGTVADRFKATVLKLAPPMDQLWDAATGQAEAVTHAAVADEASEIIGQGNGKAALPAVGGQARYGGLARKADCHRSKISVSTA
ncbi:MAG: hypothetical protein ABSE90_07170 [Verrucomicrobiota bacterium]